MREIKTVSSNTAANWESTVSFIWLVLVADPFFFFLPFLLFLSDVWIGAHGEGN